MQITNELIEELLWSGEGTSLDFKRDQYSFAVATDIDKSELLKDVLAFANAFRLGDAFILIGVEDVQGGRGIPVGVANHIDDASLQQFINSKVQRPIVFSYRAIEHDGKPIGIIHIPKQKRPFHTKLDFGKVMKGAVYVRRGSSTAIALPDEIAAMGADQIASHAVEPALECSLWDRSSGASLGHSIVIESIVLDCPPKQEIPDYRESRGQFEIATFQVNSDLYREAAEYATVRLLVKPLSFSISNSGDVTAQDVRLVMEINDPDKKLTFMEQSELPEPPSKRNELFHMRALADQMHRKNASVSVERTGGVWRVECFFGKIQPKDTVRLSEDIHAGSRESMDVALEIKLFADNLSRPLAAPALLRFAAERHKVSLEDIEKLNFKRFLDAREALANRTSPE